MRWWPRQSKVPGHFDSLTSETERFLRGQYLDDALAKYRDVPSWAWLAVLAHGDSSSLERVANGSLVHRAARPEFDTWRRVLQQLARRVLDLAEASELGLDGVQRALLMPLELDLMASPTGPAALYRAVSSILSPVEGSVDTERT